MELKAVTTRAWRKRPLQSRILAATFAVTSLAAGCTEDVGECYRGDGKNGALDTVVYNGEVQYGGQAIMNRSCASGICHSSKVKGEARQGAPAGLDFDLVPVSRDSIVEDDAGRRLVELNPEEIAGLRERRLKVFNERNRIWQQVRDGLMPPDGRFSLYKTLSSIFDSDEKSPCTAASAAFDSIDSKSSQDVLRNWLACRAPIVEAHGDVVDNTAGSAGYQYLSCDDRPAGDGGAGDGGEDGGGMSGVITIEDVFDEVFMPAGCADCHPAVNDSIDLSTPEKAYEALIGDKAIKCATNNKPYVTVGDPSKSFIYEIVAEDPACSDRMPLGGELPEDQIEMIRQWIEQGAMREADLDKSLSSRPLKLGLDAGMP